MFTFIFFCLTVIRPWLNLPTHGHGHVICIGNLGRVFSIKYSIRSHRDPQKFIFFINGRNGDHEWLRMANTLILCDLVWKVQKSHAVNREGSFNILMPSSISGWHASDRCHCGTLSCAYTLIILTNVGHLQYWLTLVLHQCSPILSIDCVHVVHVIGYLTKYKLGPDPFATLDCLSYTI